MPDLPADQRALLAAVIAAPDDDTPRLVYADWLEDHDQPKRAEFIRVECEAARTDRDDPAYPKLLGRSGLLLAANAGRWFGPLVDDRIVDHFITRRGFVDCVVLAADRYTAHVDRIAPHAPLLTRVHVRTGGDWQAFFAALGVAPVRALSFGDGVFTADAAEELAGSDNASGLVELELDRQPLGPDGMAAVAAAPLRRLERLSASECGIGDEGAEELFAGEVFRNLRDLDLSENDLTDAACHALAAASGFGRLERLTLCENGITGDGVAALAAAGHLNRLRVLNLYSNPLGPAGGRAILASRVWGGLTDINLVNCGVGIEPVEHLRWVYGDKAVKA